jgi:Calpain family cysteine protease
MTRTTKNTRGNKSIQRGVFGAVENLESRQMFSAQPFSIYTVPIGGGSTELVCQMTASSQQMSVVRSPDGIQFNLNGQVDDIAGNFAYLSIIAQGGNNSIVIGPNMLTPTCVWAGNGDDVISTGASNDDLRATGGDTTLVAMGGTNDALFGGWGYTNIWETETGNYYSYGSGQTVVHNINSFINTDDTTLDGTTFNEPGIDTQSPLEAPGTVNVSNEPLFGANGPAYYDITQGYCGDCYFLSTLSSVAFRDPQAIRNMITPLGDGTYVVEFFNNGNPEYVREDGVLPTDDGYLAYAQLGSDNSTWVALTEKAWAYYEPALNGQTADYGNIEGGNADPVYEALGASNIQGTFVDGQQWGESAFGNEAYFADWVNWELGQGNAISMGVSNGQSDQESPFSIPGILENGHEYSLLGDTLNNYGQVTGFWVRNPWGVDIEDPTTGAPELAAAGHNDGTDDGMVWISVNEAWSVMDDIGAATV